jgi:hypothetical protein
LVALLVEMGYTIVFENENFKFSVSNSNSVRFFKVGKNKALNTKIRI